MALNHLEDNAFQVDKHLNCKFPASLSFVGVTADKLIWCQSNLCILVSIKSPGLGRIAWISTLYCISSLYAVITMPVKAACSFSFQCVLIIEWQVKKPHTVVGILIPVCLSHGKQFQMGPVLYCYNTASALWHGKNALSPSGSERAIEGQPGLLPYAEALTVTQAGGWWSNNLHTTLTLKLRRQGPIMKYRCTRVKWQRNFIVGPSLRTEACAAQTSQYTA